MAKADWRKQLGGSLILTPTILLCLPIWGALNDPALLVEYWDFFLLFLGIPYLAGIALWLWAWKLPRSEGRS